MNKPIDDALKLRVERASIRAWPGVEQQYVMDWEARFAGGHTKRANSVSPLPPLARVSEHIYACEAEYALHDQPTIFKLPDFLDPVVETLLAKRGYTIADPTLVMTRDLGSGVPSIAENGLAPTMDLSTWLPAWAECHGQSVLPPAHRMILETRLAQAIYACVSAADGYCSCGLGVQVPDEQAGNLFGIFDVCTREDLRRNGHARRLVEILLAAGRDSGATICFLQVIESNIPARKLYESLGFETIYRYWYRVQS